MDRYESWSQEQLIARVRELEDQLQEAASHSESRSSTEKRTQAALADSEERIRAILHTAVEGIITIDHRGIVESANPAAEKIFGYSASEMVGRNVSILMPSPYKEQHDGYLENYHHTGRAKIIGIGREVVGQRKDGSVFPMDLSVGEVRLGSGRFYTGIVRDVTTRKAAEEKVAEMARTLEEKNKELETIVYVASHDLRSPLVNIQGFSKELAHTCARVRELIEKSGGETVDKAELERLIGQDVPEAIQYILAGVNKIDTLLSGFLRFSRLGRAALKIEPIDMQALVQNVVQTVEFQLKQSGSVVHVENLPRCTGDAIQLTQVFTNLIDNAIKYRDPRRPLVIDISGTVQGARVIYKVSDNGIGIEGKHQPKIFEIFHRLNPGASEGEGLGLTIAQRSLERQNGRISVESEQGRGSTFFVSLPRSIK